jgi:hypothetical protein
MDLVLLFLPRLPNPTFVDIVLFNIFVWYVLLIFSNKDTFLDKLVVCYIGEICKWVEKNDVHVEFLE